MLDGAEPVAGLGRPALPATRVLLVYYLGAALLTAPTSLYRVRSPVGPVLDAALLGVKALVWIGPAVLLARRARVASVAGTLGLAGPMRPRGLLAATAASALFLAAIAGLARVLGQGGPHLGRLAPLTVLLEVANAVVEELPFRGFLLGRFRARWPFWRANLAVAGLFVAVHWVPWLAMGLRVELVPLSLALGLLALVLGWVTRAAGSVWIAVALHAANNLLAMGSQGHH